MLKNIYTTRMSGAGKLLQTRFEKINTIPKRFSKMLAFISVAVLVVSLMVTSFVMANVMSETEITKSIPEIHITNNGKQIPLDNKPFVENGEVYVPLRELFTKLELMEGTSAKIDWDNGVVLISLGQKNLNEDVIAEYTNYLYKIEIGKSELIVNPEVLMHRETPDEVTSVVEPMNNAPILKENVTYIPFSYAVRMVERADWGLLSPPDLYQLGVIYSGETLSIIYPCTEYCTISQPFGKRVHPITGEEKLHTGVDFNAEEGTPVKAGIDGTITASGFDEEKGYYVIIENDIGVEILYAHLSGYVKRETPDVSAQDIVGYVGSTGKATGPHLHMEVKINGEYVNPELYLEKTVVSELVIAVHEQFPRTIERLNLQGYKYQIKNIDIFEDTSFATVTIQLTNDSGESKIIEALYCKLDDAWKWQEMTVEEI